MKFFDKLFYRFKKPVKESPASEAALISGLKSLMTHIKENPAHEIAKLVLPQLMELAEWLRNIEPGSQLKENGETSFAEMTGVSSPQTLMDDLEALQMQDTKDVSLLEPHDLAMLRALQQNYHGQLVTLQKRKDAEMERLSSNPSTRDEKELPPLGFSDEKRLEVLLEGEMPHDVFIQVVLDFWTQFHQVPRRELIRDVYTMDSRISDIIHEMALLYRRMKEE